MLFLSAISLLLINSLACSKSSIFLVRFDTSITLLRWHSSRSLFNVLTCFSKFSLMVFNSFLRSASKVSSSSLSAIAERVDLNCYIWSVSIETILSLSLSSSFTSLVRYISYWSDISIWAITLYFSSVFFLSNFSSESSALASPNSCSIIDFFSIRYLSLKSLKMVIWSLNMVF